MYSKQHTASSSGHSISAVGFIAALGIGSLAIVLQSCTAEQNDIVGNPGYITPSIVIDPVMHYQDSQAILEIDTSEIPSAGEMVFSLATSDGRFAHTWDRFAEYDPSRSFQSGNYNLSVSTPRYMIERGYVSFGAFSSFSLTPAERLTIPVTVTPQVSRIECSFGETVSDGLVLSGILVHGAGGGYEIVSAGANNGHVYVSPGEAYLIAEVGDGQGRNLNLITDAGTFVRTACVTDAHASLHNGELTVSLGNTSWNTRVDETIFYQPSPSLDAVGFDPDVPFQAIEGIPLKNPFMVNVTSSRPLKHIFMNVDSPIYGDSLAKDYDLLNPGDIDIDFKEADLKIDVAPDRLSASIDFTETLENVATRTSARTMISMIAVDDRGVCSAPMSFEVITSTVDFRLVSSTPAVIGKNKASITLATTSPLVETSDFRIIARNFEGGEDVVCQVTDTHINDDKTKVTVDFDAPAGVYDFDVDVEYMDVNRLSVTIHRAKPVFGLTFDSYATSIFVHIDSPDEDVIKAVASMASFTANRNRVTVWERYPEEGVVILSGLNPSTEYVIEARLGNLAPASGSSTVTEAAAQIPESDFEDIKEIISYKNLPQGGRYSATDLNIINRQNYTDVTVSWPKKYWASVNAKTFCNKTANANTWYMQPSSEIVYDAVSGSKSIKLTSVGWDLNGENIPDYVQRPNQFLPYNNNVPKVSHRSSGKLFLGSYEFNATAYEETYKEGIPFGSRPSSLNGFYKYHPDLTHPQDRGKVHVKVFGALPSGEEVLIAEGEEVFRFAPDFTAFNVPIEYHIRGIRATRLCVMFASSSAEGSLSEEDSAVPVTAIPERSAMIGSSLWIDNLSLSY